MKKIIELKSMSEPCLAMSISKVSTNLEAEKEFCSENSVGNNDKNNYIKSEDLYDKIDIRKSPPLQTLGPGAEIKGKICHPIPSSSKIENVEPGDESSKPIPAGVSGGRLTFFREGRPLLELSHRTDQGSSWVQVKSKTYWPPSSTTTTTATQHPLKHDTVSDDCSSMNSSPWASEHIRKQIGPNHRIYVSQEEQFFYKSSLFSRSLRGKIRLRRNQLLRIVGPTDPIVSQLNHRSSSCSNKDIKVSERRNRLESKVQRLHEFRLSKVDVKTAVAEDSTFVSPRKRYLRALDGEVDSLARKKASISKHCDRPSSSSPSFHTPHKSAINHNSSYSIDSLLSTETSDTKKSESFLRHLLKPELKNRSPKPPRETLNHIKNESLFPKEDVKRAELELARYSQSLYLNPYSIDPRYMMLHPLLPPVSQPDVAAAVAAAAAGYSLSSLQMSAYAAANPLLGTSFAASGSQLLRSPGSASSRSLPHSPKPSTHLPRVASPREGLWSPSSFNSSSPHKISNENPPPQDAPLNLSKPKGKS